MWVSAAHLSELENIDADSFSQNLNKATEGKLSTHLLQSISQMFDKFTLDIFASGVNHQIKRFIFCNSRP